MTDETLHIKDSKKEYHLPLSEIVFIKNDGNYCDIFLTKHVIYRAIRITLSEIMERINKLGTYADHHLLKASRSLIVNTSFITDINLCGDYENPDDPNDVHKGVPVITLSQEIIKSDCVKHEISQKGLKELLSLKKKDEKDVLLKTYGKNLMLSVPVSELNEELQTYNGHEYVDLGLPSKTLWATHNIYATMIESGYDDLVKRDCRYTKESFETCEYDCLTQEDIDAYKVTDDIANNHWRGDWQMPTKADFQELKDECNWVWCRTKNNKLGALIYGKNGNALFLPADEDKKVEGHYWTSESMHGTPVSADIEEDRECGGVKLCIAPSHWVELAFVRPVLHKSNKG